MENFKIESKRIIAMLQLAGVSEKKEADVEKYLNQSGIERTVEKLNDIYSTNLQIGEYVIQSKENKGFWSNDFGWCSHKDAGSGFTEEDLSFYKDNNGVAKPNFHDVTDASFVLYTKAKNFKSL